jgi:hypothetical protein
LARDLLGVFRMNLIAAVMLSLVAQPHRVTVVSIDVDGIRTFGVEPVRLVLEGDRCARQLASPDSRRTFEVEACTLPDGHVDVRWTLHDGAQYLKRQTLGVNWRGAHFDAGIEHLLAVKVKVE